MKGKDMEFSHWLKNLALPGWRRRHQKSGLGAGFKYSVVFVPASLYLPCGCPVVARKTKIRVIECGAVIHPACGKLIGAKKIR